MAGKANNIALELLKENGRDIVDVPPPGGAQPPAGGAQPPAGGAQPPAGGANPPAGGAQPPADPPAGGTRPAGGATPPAGGANPPGGAQPPADAPADDIDDEKLRAALLKRGIKVDKLDQLKPPPAAEPTAEEKEKARIEKHEAAIQHALKAKTIKASDITAYELDKQKPARDVVYPFMMEKWKKDFPDATQEELDERFAEYYLENKKPDDWHRKEREQLMAAQAESIINNRHSKVLGIDSAYSEYEETIEAAKGYNAVVDATFEKPITLEPFTIEVDGEGGAKTTESYTFEFSKETVNAVKEQLKTEDSFNRIGRSGLDETAMNALVRNALIEKELGNIVRTVARSHANKMVIQAKAGRKGALPETVGAGTVEGNVPRTKSIAEQMLDENKRP